MGQLLSRARAALARLRRPRTRKADDKRNLLNSSAETAHGANDGGARANDAIASKAAHVGPSPFDDDDATQHGGGIGAQAEDDGPVHDGTGYSRPHSPPAGPRRRGPYDDNADNDDDARPVPSSPPMPVASPKPASGRRPAPFDDDADDLAQVAANAFRRKAAPAPARPPYKDPFDDDDDDGDGDGGGRTGDHAAAFSGGAVGDSHRRPKWDEAGDDDDNDDDARDHAESRAPNANQGAGAGAGRRPPPIVANPFGDSDNDEDDGGGRPAGTQPPISGDGKRWRHARAVVATPPHGSSAH